jgi:hypothetical protein
MKVLKKIAVSLLIASAMGIASAPAMAESDPGRITYKPADAIEAMSGLTKKAIDAISTGTSGEDAANLIKAALDMGKEINANDKVDAARSRINKKLKSAITHVKEGAGQEAEQELRDAYKGTLGLKDLL